MISVVAVSLKNKPPLQGAAVDLHDTHDLVQVWNRDPNATGVRLHSHAAFCARCHYPREGEFRKVAAAAKRTVFSEEKHGITCLGCHDPHDHTGGGYRRDRVSLAQIGRAHV